MLLSLNPDTASAVRNIPNNTHPTHYNPHPTNSQYQQTLKPTNPQNMLSHRTVSDYIIMKGSAEAKKSRPYVELYTCKMTDSDVPDG